jgi:hypothetical protein
MPLWLGWPAVSKKRGQQHKKSWSRRRLGKPESRRPRDRVGVAPPQSTVKIVARSWESVAAEEPLRFPIPPTAADTDPAVSDYWWRLIQYATDLEDPTTFPPFDHQISESTVRTWRRYARTARELARSAALNHPIEMEVTVKGGAEVVTSDVPAADATAGFAVMLRHFYAPAEKASFQTVLKLLQSETAQDPSPLQADRFAQLEVWKRVEGRTRNRSIQNQAIKRLIADGRAPDDPELERYPDHAPPEQTISDYFYGDHIHWDSKADVVDERAADPFLDAYYRHSFFEAAAGLAHLYVGFASLVESAMSRQAGT